MLENNYICIMYINKHGGVKKQAKREVSTYYASMYLEFSLTIAFKIVVFKQLIAVSWNRANKNNIQVVI